MAVMSSSCPRCTEILIDGALDEGEGLILSCRSCGGHWLDNVACQRLVHVDVPPAVHALLRSKPKRPAFGGSGGYRTAARRGSDVDEPAACVICNMMTAAYVTDPRVFGARVRLDVCEQHGTWFDEGEAWALLQAATLSRADTHAHASVTVSNAVRASWSAEWLAQNAKFREGE
jgi:Zn-finger nucleic acid-binding protein